VAVPSTKQQPDPINERLTVLPSLGATGLQELWKQLFPARPYPLLRRNLLIPILAYRLQEQASGSLSANTRSRLRQLAVAYRANPNAKECLVPIVKPGTRLVRQWRDRVHTVTVEENGYQYEGCRYQSLSQITRLITGTNWSGPLFFGLKSRQRKKPLEAL
jgi:hypothetical protein